MKKSEAFRIARAKIARDEETFICLALPYSEAGKACSDIVMERLEGACTYNDWLFRHQPDWYLLGNFTPGRLAWLDSLIAEWEAKGD